MKLSMEELAALGGRLHVRYNYDPVGPFCVPAALRRLEIALHEFAHLAVLNLTPTRAEADGSRISWKIRDRLALKTPRASDLSECATLAVEFRAARLLGMELDQDALIHTALLDSRRLSIQEFRATVHRYERDGRTKPRTERVLRWVRPYL
jgi:hypothetical protein